MKTSCQLRWDKDFEYLKTELFEDTIKFLQMDRDHKKDDWEKHLCFVAGQIVAMRRYCPPDESHPKQEESK